MNRYDYIIAGCGAAGLQLAYAMSEDTFFRNKRILLLDSNDKSSNDRTWCWWEKGVGKWDSLITKSWSKADFMSDTFQKTLDLGNYRYKMLRSSDFYAHVKKRLHELPMFEWRTEEVISIEEHEQCACVQTKNGRYEASVVFNSIIDLKAVSQSSQHPWIHQHFVGWFIRTEKPTFDDTRFTMMDFRVEQKGNTRFMYVLPTSANEALFEYTLFSSTLLSQEEYEQGIRDYLANAGIHNYEIIESEAGIIPMTTHPFHRKNSAHVLHIGSAGGWTKPSTGYTFYLSGAYVKRLCEWLKDGKPITSFHRRSRFALYDAVVIDMLQRRNELGAVFFTSVYSKQPVERVLRFLNEESQLSDEIKIILRASPRKELMRSARSAFLR
jgi:lycopene beta-cyclase